MAPATPLRRSARQKHQTRLSFTPVLSSSPAAVAHLSPNLRTRAAAVTLSGSPNPAKRRKVAFSSHKEEDDSEDELYKAPDAQGGDKLAKGLPTPERSSQVKSSGRRHQPTVEPGSESEEAREGEQEDEPVQKTSKPAFKRRVTRQSKLNFDQGQSDEVKEHRRAVRSINEGAPVKAKSRLRSGPFRSTQQTIELSSDSDTSFSDVDPPRADKAAKRDSVGEAETSGDDVIVSSPAKKPKRAAARKESWVISGDSDAEVQITPKRTKPQATKEQPSDEEDDDLPATQRKRRLPPSTPRRRSKQEEEDLEEDLEFLGSSGGRLKKKPERSPRKPVQSARQKALEALKRRRAGDKTKPTLVELDDDSAEEGRRRGLYDTDTESDDGEDELEGIEDEDEVVEPPRRNGRSNDANDMFLADDDDEDFIVEDDEDAPLGAPVDLPLEFSNLSRQKGKDLFKYVVEWMVQKKINPAFAIDDEIYDLAFRKLDDEVRGLAGSKFTSSAWTPSFTQALRSRPNIVVTGVPGGTSLYDHCAACNRKNHPATWQIQFTGKPYHKETLEEVADDEDSEEETDGKTYDADGREVPDESIVYNLGKTCKQNAEIAHTLEHWRYHLNDWVVEYLKAEGYTAPEKIVERDEWSTKKRQKYANEIADEMERTGEIKRLYRDYRNEVDTARGDKLAGSGRQLELDFD
ncbi:hypothetical protein H2201_004200 [Coniosporium apollinis]|uniref:DUF4211 domain-containing protein n=2 Tax=Coniosporium TaxID=2810619 RepID=A0ABQ9NTL7_9PEZI|nr:hypothetical protein H2199_007256 [Cladosporium sp. JES 115]KAJ9665716.1 hypothetical protein H2201_004200 [Coniosporium apollinis]